MTEVRAALPAQWPSSDALALWALMSVEPGDELERISAELRATVVGCGLDGLAVDDEAILARYGWLDREIAPFFAVRPGSKLDRESRSHSHPSRLRIRRVSRPHVVLFQSLFAWADPAITLVESAFSALGDGVRAILPASVLD
jgi:hypothetical protein